VYQWMQIAHLSPTVGKFIVCIYRELRKADHIDLTPRTWHSWLLERLIQDASLLESVKNYIFLPFFKTDKIEALYFLREVNKGDLISPRQEANLDTAALLQLTALETGKRVGLVEDPREYNRNLLPAQTSRTDSLPRYW
jgi:hypothetical protein